MEDMSKEDKGTVYFFSLLVLSVSLFLIFWDTWRTTEWRNSISIAIIVQKRFVKELINHAARNTHCLGIPRNKSFKYFTDANLRDFPYGMFFVLYPYVGCAIAVWISHFMCIERSSRNGAEINKKIFIELEPAIVRIDIDFNHPRSGPEENRI